MPVLPVPTVIASPAQGIGTKILGATGSVPVQRNVDHDRLSAVQTPVASRNASCEVDGITLINHEGPNHAEVEQCTAAEHSPSRTPSLQPRTDQQLARRHKKTQSEYVLSRFHRRKPSDANTQRRSWILESAHEMRSVFRRSQIFQEMGITDKREVSKAESPEEIEHVSKSHRIHVDRRANRLKDQLKGAAIRSSVCNKQFVPDDQLADIITQKSVDTELSRWEYLPRKVRHALRRPTDVPIENKGSSYGGGNTYRKIFAILLEIHRPSLIWSFVEDEVCDYDLPLMKEFYIKGTQTRFGLRRTGHPTVPLKCFKKWSWVETSEFEDRQWMFLAPSFDKPIGNDDSHQNFQSDRILPFTKCTAVRRGGYGKVYETEIHPGHHALEDMQGKRCLVAVKHLLGTDTGAAQREANILRGMSKRPHAHRHVISLLATYEYCGEYYLMFPWAQADLERFWKESRGPYGGNNEMAMWLLEQCLGLAKGLYQIHRYLTIPRASKVWQDSLIEEASRATVANEVPQLLFGRHGDIKPNNILFFPDGGSSPYGVLKLTDFGITRFGTDPTQPPFHENERVPYTPTYQSPECLSKKDISTLCDIWALGCVYLEFALWYFRGYDHVKAFSQKRQEDDVSDAFFEKVGKNPSTGSMRLQVKPCVSELLLDLRAEERCGTPLDNFLGLIETNMIVLKNDDTTSGANKSPADAAIRPSSSVRIGSGTLVGKLGTILEDYRIQRAAETMIKPT